MSEIVRHPSKGVCRYSFANVIGSIAGVLVVLFIRGAVLRPSRVLGSGIVKQTAADYADAVGVRIGR